jgi:uncharacterized protein (UPF0371 family)
VTISQTTPAAPHGDDVTAFPLISAVVETLLRESAVESPTDQDRVEARRLATSVIDNATLTLKAVTGISEWTRNRLTDLATLVADDPETATVEQVQEIAHALQSLLSHPRHAGMRL